MEKLRFQDAQVGDSVYSRIVGDGEVIHVFAEEDTYRLRVKFTSGHVDLFTAEGKSSPSHVEPILFYRKGADKHLTERPEPEVDWAKVPIGVSVKVSDRSQQVAIDMLNYTLGFKFMGYFPDLELPFWVFKSYERTEARGCKYCVLAEPCKPEWRK